MSKSQSTVKTLFCVLRMGMSAETDFMLHALEDRGLEIDEYDPIDDSTFQDLLEELGRENEEIADAFKACFEIDESTSEAYPKVSGKDDLVELFEKNFAGDGIVVDDDD